VSALRIGGSYYITSVWLVAVLQENPGTY